MHQSGYVIIIFGREGDWPSEHMTAKCAEYSRAFPYISFGTVDSSVAGTLVGGAMLTCVPTTAIYRSGVMCGRIEGTDYASLERALESTRRDGAALIVGQQHASPRNYMNIPLNAAIFAPRKPKH
jgi:hypothetical protein